MKKKIAVITGGYSHEAQISVKSGQTVMAAIDDDKYEPINITIDSDGWFAVLEGQKFPVDKNDFSVSWNEARITFDAVFIVIHGTPGEDGKLQAYFDMLNIPYTTSGVLPSSLTFNKYVCNTFLTHNGIRCAKSQLVRKTDKINPEEIAQELSLPLFVKPSDGGSSFGVTKVKVQEEIPGAISLALGHGTEALLESFISGTEVTCGIIGTKEGITVLPATEIVSKNEFFDFNAKYKGDSEEITPARISSEMMSTIQSITEKAYILLGLRGLARIDFIIMDDKPYLIEVNTVPGLSAESIIPQQARSAGISLKDLFNRMIEDTLG